MKNNRNVREFAELQYESFQNLTNRINLWSYGSNPESLQKWIFNKIPLKGNETVLELGCGTGKLWLENFRKVPSTCLIVLSDFSKNMLKKARNNLQPLKLPIKFKIINAEHIPYPNQTFDVVIACHMLYHIPDIEKALMSISRVLKPDGTFVSTTISKQHLQELNDFLSDFGLYSEEKLKFFSEFRNETGREVLKSYFKDVNFYEYINPVNIKNVSPLMNYIESMFIADHYPNFKEKKPQIELAIANIIKRNSKFKITGITGLFEAKKPRNV